MNQKIFNEAMGYVDDDLVESYLSQKEMNISEKEKQGWRKTVKWFLAAACISFAMIFVLPLALINLGGFGSEDDGYYESTHTQVKTFDELEAIVGNDTLLSNFDFSSEEYTFEIEHEPNNVSAYHSVNIESGAEDRFFKVYVYFPPYDETDTDFCFSGNFKVINSVKMEVDKIKDEGEAYEYAVQFVYDSCKYVVRGGGNKNEAEFWNKVYQLIGE